MKYFIPKKDGELMDSSKKAEKYGYIIIDSKPIPIAINGKEFVYSYNGFKGDIKEYKYVIIK